MTRRRRRTPGLSRAGRGQAKREPAGLVPGSRVVTGLLLGVVLLAAAAANTGPIANNDYGLHLRIGQEVADSWRPVLVDYHSHTIPGAPYPDHEWLTQGAFFKLHELLGDGGMVALKGLLVGAALALTAASVPGPVLLKLAAVTAVMLLGFDHSHMRPHLLSWVFAGLLNLLLERRLNWAVLALLLLWGNSHGSVLLGVGIAALHFLELFWQTRQRRLLIWAAACAVAPLFNPNGTGIYTLFFEISGHTAFIGEWQPYTPDKAAFWLLAAIVGLATFRLLKTRPLNPFDLLRVSALGFLGFQSSRNGVIAAVFLAPLLGRCSGPIVSRWSPRLQRVAAALLAAVVLVALGIRASQERALRFELDPEHLPVAAVRFVQRHGLAGPVFNDYNFGGYFLWRAWPDHPVFVDGRTEVYKGQVLDEYLAVSGAEPGWEEIVERYGISFFVVRPERDVGRVLLDHEGWDLVYFDYNAAIFVRDDLFADLRRLYVVSPYGHRDSSRVDEAIEEISYLLDENPLFFGGQKILAFLLYRRGDLQKASDALHRYLELHPQGTKLEETRSLVEALQENAVWP